MGAVADTGAPNVGAAGALIGGAAAACGVATGVCEGWRLQLLRASRIWRKSGNPESSTGFFCGGGGAGVAALGAAEAWAFMVDSSVQSCEISDCRPLPAGEGTAPLAGRAVPGLASTGKR